MADSTAVTLFQGNLPVRSGSNKGSPNGGIHKVTNGRIAKKFAPESRNGRSLSQSPKGKTGETSSRAVPAYKDWKPTASKPDGGASQKDGKDQNEVMVLKLQLELMAQELEEAKAEKKEVKAELEDVKGKLEESKLDHTSTLRSNDRFFRQNQLLLKQARFCCKDKGCTRQTWFEELAIDYGLA